MQTPIRLETDSEASARMIWNCLFRQKDAPSKGSSNLSIYVCQLLPIRSVALHVVVTVVRRVAVRSDQLHDHAKRRLQHLDVMTIVGLTAHAHDAIAAEGQPCLRTSERR